jgi:hypothetical protein
MPVTPLIDVNELRERFDIDNDLKDGRLTPHIGSASRRLRQWVGDTVYATTDEDIKADLENAEAHLAMHFAVLGLNSPMSYKGVFITETSTEGKAVRRYLDPKQISELAQMYLDQAQELVQKYTLTDGTPAAPFDVIGSTDCTIDTSCEAVTRICNG